MTENSPEIPLSVLLEETLQKKGIIYGLFDVDGTLLDTHGYYDEYMDKYAGVIAGMLGGRGDFKEVRVSMSRILNGLRPQFSVNEALMNETARITALRYGQDYYSETIQNAASDLMDLYTGIPPSFDGVYDTLELLYKSKLGLVVASHSEDPWTRVKLAKNGLLGFFDKGIFTFDTFGEKGEREWNGVLNALNARPEQVIVVGDSIGSDISPTLKLGVPPEQIFRIATDYGDANKGALDIRVRQLSKFADLPYAILDKLN